MKQLLQCCVAILKIIVVLERLWNEQHFGHNFLVGFVRPDYKITVKKLKNIKDDCLTDDIITICLDELVPKVKEVRLLYS